MDPRKLSPFKQIFHAIIGDRYKRWLESPKTCCCRKTHKYKTFEDGNKIFDHEIDIVRLLQYFRFMRHFTKNLVV